MGRPLCCRHAKNTGKGGALMNGLNYATCDRFLSDADTYVPPDQDGMGYMLAEIERGADAVGGIPSTALKGAGLLPHIRATVKLPMIVMKRTLQQLWAAHRLLSAVPAGCSVLMYCVSSVSRIVLKSKTLISPDISGKRLPYSAGESLHRIPTGMQQPA